MTQVPLTAALGDFVAGVRYESIPQAAIAIAKQGIADCVGVMLAGSIEPAVQAVRRAFESDTAGGGSSICFGSEQAPAHVAAWVNGTAAHVLDYDDVALKGSHPSAVLVPAILAEAEALGASGPDMLRAYVAGFETWGELISRDKGNYQRKGWHPTGVFGAVGAAAACAALRGATTEEATRALGIAASQASGVMANLGFTTKPMHAGKAAACGLLAARFAAAGLTAAPNALEHEQGYLSALSPAGEVDRERAPALPPMRWRLFEQGLAIKQYPVCYRAHRAIDAMLGLVRGHGIEAADVKAITVRFSPSHAVILKNHRPRTAIDAKFSIEFALACALVARRVGLRDLVDEFVLSESIQRLIPLVSIEIESEEMPGTSGYAPCDLVRVQTAAGGVLESEHVRYARGDPQAPLSAEELWTKFDDCSVWSGLQLDARELFDKLNTLEHCRSAAGTSPETETPSIRR